MRLDKTALTTGQKESSNKKLATSPDATSNLSSREKKDLDHSPKNVAKKNSDPLGMPPTGKKTSPWKILVVLLLLGAAGSAYFLLDQDGTTTTPKQEVKVADGTLSVPAENQTKTDGAASGVVEKSPTDGSTTQNNGKAEEQSPNTTEQEKNTAQKTQDDASTQAQAVLSENTPDSTQEASGPVRKGAPLPVEDPNQALKEHIQHSIQDSTVLENGDSSSGTLSDTAKNTAEPQQDSVVTAGFVRDISDWLAACYVSPRYGNGRGYSTASLIQANSHFANSPNLRHMEQDSREARVSILRHAYSAGMLKALFRLYSPSLLNEMEQSLSRTGRAEDKADFFAVNAELFHRLAVSLHAASRTDIEAHVRDIHDMADKEKAANSAFSRSYTAFNKARNNEDVQGQEAINADMMALAEQAAVHAQQQERAKRNLANTLRQQSQERMLSDAELLFLSEWLVRRHGSKETVRIAAELCADLAALCEKRAEEIKVNSQTNGN